MTQNAAKHEAAADARIELQLQRRFEAQIRRREQVRLVGPLVQEPAHEFATPIPSRHRPDVHQLTVDHMMAPGTEDDTGFSDGTV